MHATVDSVEAFGKVITYPTKVDEYLILRHLHERLRPPAAVPKPLCRAVGEYRGILTERVNGETLDTLWARREGPSPELVGEAVRRLHEALEVIETPWCSPGIAGDARAAPRRLDDLQCLMKSPHCLADELRGRSFSPRP